MKKIILCLLAILFTATSLHAETFKIESFYYHNPISAGQASIGNKVVFNTDQEFFCEGMNSKKVFFHTSDRHSNSPTNGMTAASYALDRFWPSTFFRSAALAGASIEADLGAYDPITDACEVMQKKILAPYSNTMYFNPQVFTVSEKGSGNFISKVYYQKIVYSGSNYYPWVYADTNTEITCTNGTTTNRVIPKPNPNGVLGGLALGGVHATQLFDGLLSGTISSYKVGKYDSLRDGCIIDDVVFTGNLANQGGTTQDGIQQCIDDPLSCGLFDQTDLDNAFGLGVQLCMDDPTSCGLFSQSDVDNALAAGQANGMQQCKNDPASCGLFSQVDLDNASAAAQALGVQQGIVQGVQQCIDDPSSCNLFDQQFVDNSITQIVNQIINELPKGQVTSTCKKNPSSPLCQ